MKILYIEDDPGLAKLAKRKLEQKGYFVFLANTIAEGKALLGENKFDCVLTDYALPDGRGTEFMEEYKKSAAHIPWVVITALGNEKLAVEAMKKGASDYIVKDIEASYLDLLHSILHRTIGIAKLKQSKALSEQQLIETTIRLRLLFNSSFDLLIVCDKQWKIIDASENALKHYAEIPEHFINKNLFKKMCIDKHDTETLLSHKDDKKTVELTMTIGQHRFPACVRKKPLNDGNYLISFRDTSDRQALVSAQKTVSRVTEERDRYEASSKYLRQALKKSSNKEMIGVSPQFKNILTTIEQAALVDASVLVIGETGTGKELVANLLHELSSRSDQNLIKVNCAALPTELVESELFGHVKGSFTGAYQNKIGRFEAAHQGTLVLDEIGEFPLTLQSKLLRALQSGEFQQIGSNETKQVNARIVALTNRDLKMMVEQGQFREDLYYRLNVIPISLPPLRERKEDIPLLFNSFLSELQETYSRSNNPIPPSTNELLMEYHWPGNIRELRNFAERGLAIGNWHLPKQHINASEKTANISAISTLADNEKQHIIKALDACNGVLSGSKGAAALLNINANTLRARMNKLGITTSGRRYV